MANLSFVTMITFSSKVTYPKNADSKTAYRQHINNLKKKIKNVDMPGKKAAVHFSCDGKVISTDITGDRVLKNKIYKAIFE